MQNTVLILGPTGRLGRNAALAFEAAGWEVRRFDREKDNLWDAAWGATVIVNGWNPPYPQWASEVPDQTEQVIEVAKASGATVIIPGNVYVYGAQAPERFGPDTPHMARNPLGRLRIDMEEAYRTSGVQTFIVRAGDYLDTEASGNWFDMIIAKPHMKGTISYPGPLDCQHAFTYLPDVAATMVAMAERRETLSRFEDISVPSFNITGRELAKAIADLKGTPVRAKKMAWWPLRLAGMVWPMGRALIEMSYLWCKPHHIDATRHEEMFPNLPKTPLSVALSRALNLDIHPNQSVRPSSEAIAAE